MERAEVSNFQSEPKCEVWTFRPHGIVEITVTNVNELINSGVWVSQEAVFRNWGAEAANSYQVASAQRVREQMSQRVPVDKKV